MVIKQLTEEIINTTDNKKFIVGLFIDLKKSF